MASRNSTIQKHHYRIKRVPRKYVSATFPEPWVWKVYRDGYSWAGFKTHELALSYAIEHTNVEHVGDWMLMSTILDSRWIMFLINMDRQMVKPIADKRYNSMNRRQAQQWLNNHPMSYDLGRRQEVFIYNEDLERAIAETRIGEWAKYERAQEDSDSSE